MSADLLRTPANSPFINLIYRRQIPGNYCVTLAQLMRFGFVVGQCSSKRKRRSDHGDIA